MSRISLDPPRTLRYRVMSWFARRKFGAELDPGRVMGHHLGVATGYGMLEMSVLRWKAVPRRYLDERQLVELTMMVAVENLRSRFNSAAGLTGQGFKELCEVPEARARAEGVEDGR